MNLLVITTSKVVEYAVDNTDSLTDDGTYLTVEGSAWHTRPANEYTIYKNITVPSDYKHDKYKYDGSSFTANADYKEDTTYIKVIDDKEYWADKDDDGVEHIIGPR